MNCCDLLRAFLRFDHSLATRHTVRRYGDEQEWRALEFVVSPVIVGDDGNYKSSANVYSGKEKGFKSRLDAQGRLPTSCVERSKERETRNAGA